MSHGIKHLEIIARMSRGVVVDSSVALAHQIPDIVDAAIAEHTTNTLNHIDTLFATAGCEQSPTYLREYLVGRSGPLHRIQRRLRRMGTRGTYAYTRVCPVAFDETGLRCRNRRNSASAQPVIRNCR